MDESSKKFQDTQYPLYIIHSGWSFNDIYGILMGFTSNEKDIGNLKAEYDSHGRDTNRSLILMNPSVFEEALKSGSIKRRGFQINKYKVSTEPLKVRSLCIPIPPSKLFTGKQIRDILRSKLQPFVKFGVLQNIEDVEILVPLRSREADIPMNVAYLNFESHVSDEAITIIRIMLHHSYWKDYTDNVFIECYFAKRYRKTTSLKVNSILRKSEE